jgi:hypothetical protein
MWRSRCSGDAASSPATFPDPACYTRKSILYKNAHSFSSAPARAVVTRHSSRLEEASGLTLDPDAGGPGIRDWLKRIGDGHALAAAFDTRINGVAAFTGRASRGIDKLLKAHGYNIVAPPESFLIGQGARCSTARRCVPADGVAAVGAAASNVSFAQRR